MSLPLRVSDFVGINYFSWKHQNPNYTTRENIKRGKNHLSTTNNIAPVQYYSYQNNESGKSLFLALKLANVWGSKKSNIWTLWPNAGRLVYIDLWVLFSVWIQNYDWKGQKLIHLGLFWTLVDSNFRPKNDVMKSTANQIPGGGKNARSKYVGKFFEVIQDQFLKLGTKLTLQTHILKD